MEITNNTKTYDNKGISYTFPCLTQLNGLYIATKVAEIEDLKASLFQSIKKKIKVHLF